MDHGDIVESIARGMIERFGAEAAHLARAEAGDMTSMSDSETWHDIADAIDRLSREP